MHKAVRKKNLETVRFLKNKGATTVDTKNSSGETPLSYTTETSKNPFRHFWKRWVNPEIQTEFVKPGYEKINAILQGKDSGQIVQGEKEPHRIVKWFNSRFRSKNN